MVNSTVCDITEPWMIVPDDSSAIILPIPLSGRPRSHQIVHDWKTVSCWSSAISRSETTRANTETVTSLPHFNFMAKMELCAAAHRRCMSAARVEEKFQRPRAIPPVIVRFPRTGDANVEAQQSSRRV